MINLNFALRWSGNKLSYLRYLTFKTLRHFHPHSRIQLYHSRKFKEGRGDEKQGFAKPDVVKEDYLEKLKELNIEMVRFDYLSKYWPNHQSDVFRWWWLKNHGGFYLDTDQIILRPFRGLPLAKYKFIYSCYEVISPYAPEGKFAPVGVLGASKDSKIVDYVNSVMLTKYKINNYNSIGPFMMMDILNKVDMSEAFNAPYAYFYPAPICNYVSMICDGSLKLDKNNYALHWFGGCDRITKFKNIYSEEFAKTSKDTISKFLREKRLI
jgi:hypothetical protein